MKFSSRKEQRKVTERMVALLEPIKYYLDEDTRECVAISLRILFDTGVESEKQDERGND
jgi:hypothetical protein